MEYFSTPFNISLLKNHVLKDPILDWFNIQECLFKNSYIRDKNNCYKDFIIKEYQNYKDNFFNGIIKNYDKEIKTTNSTESTYNSLKKNEKLILNGKLLYDNMIVYCDIIIHIDLFNKIFPNIKNYDMKSIKNQYILINLSYSCINFKKDLKESLNDGVLPYKKCVLFSFSKCFERIFKYSPKTFIIGKEYYYKKEKLKKDNYISYVLPCENIIRRYIKAYNWINFLRKNIKSMKIYNKPSHEELYPNMNIKDSEWETEKMKVAKIIKEITLVWNISYEERCQLHKKGIYCWDDNKLINELKESKKKIIQERMIHMNKTNDILVYPRKNISSILKEILKEKDTSNIFFDVESFLNIEEKNHFFNKKEIIFSNPILAILGFYHCNTFYDFTIQNFTTYEEKKIIEKFSKELWKIYDNHGRINIFHWGHAECKYLDYIHKTYNDIHFPEYILIDLLEHFRLEPIIVKGVFKFSLKTIGKALFNHNLIQTTWDNQNDNGLDAMIKFKEICIKNKKIPIKRYVKIKEIVEYNQIDCKVLKEIHEFLLKKYIY